MIEPRVQTASGDRSILRATRPSSRTSCTRGLRISSTRPETAILMPKPVAQVRVLVAEREVHGLRGDDHGDPWQARPPKPSDA